MGCLPTNWYKHKLATLNLIDCITDQGGRWEWGNRVGVGGDGEAVEVPIYPFCLHKRSKLHFQIWCQGQKILAYLQKFSTPASKRAKPVVFDRFSYFATFSFFYNTCVLKTEKRIFLEYVCKNTFALAKQKSIFVKRLHFFVQSQYAMKYDDWQRFWCWFGMCIYEVAK